ncbi:MAG: hypothetical protein IJM14_10445 [Lachnospiraceae bacterium]|nr:hypothetical protein [Lachnospiraceae bacterium]
MHLNEDNSWTDKIENLPVYDYVTGNKLTYTWTEGEMPQGYSLKSSVESDTANGKLTTLTNSHTPETISITAKKAWLNADETTEAPEGANVVFGLFEKDGTEAIATIILDGTVDEEAEAYESEAWTASFTNLPKYKAGQVGVEIEYVVKETIAYSDYTDQNPDGVSDGETITNKQDTGKILIRKTIKGDITDEDRAGLTFVVKDKDGNEVGTYKLGEDFDEEKDDDGNVVSYVKTIEVPVGRYTVEETLYKLDGTKETVKYSVDNSEAKEGTETEEFTVVKDETNTVEYEDDYELFGNISIRKTIKGDITDEDRAGLTFVVKDKDGNEVGTYKLGTDFDEEKDDDGNVVSYVKTIEVPVGKYTVEETLYRVDGSTVTVTYVVDNGEVKEGDTTEEFDVERGKTTTVEYENDYKEEESSSKTDDENDSSSGSTDGGSEERGPKTGDDMQVKTLAFIAVLSIIVAVFAKKKEDAE